MSTLLKIRITLGGSIPTTTVPTLEQLRATSTLALDNGTFAIDGTKLRVQPGVPVKLEFVDARTVAITAMGTVSGTNIVFPTSRIAVDGLQVALVGQPIALTGTMTHRAGTGTMSVASTDDPQGDVLANLVKSRKMALALAP